LPSPAVSASAATARSLSRSFFASARPFSASAATARFDCRDARIEKLRGEPVDEQRASIARLIRGTVVRAPRHVQLKHL